MCACECVLPTQAISLISPETARSLITISLTSDLMAAKANSRETAKAEKEADIILSSLARASEAATATTLLAITETLKKVPLMYHIHALLQNEEWKAVLEAAALGHSASTDTSGAKPDKEWKLRTNVKKFEHLTRQRQPKPDQHFLALF